MDKPGKSKEYFLSGLAIALYLFFAKTIFHFIFTGKYGYFRDELYYLACADHPAWGYVDHPPLSILVLYLVRRLIGDSLFAIRLIPVLAGGIPIIFAALIAREMGGRRFAQALAALATFTAPIFLAHSTYFSMNSLDLFFTAAAIYIFTKIIGTDNMRLWLPFGFVAGLGLLNKFNIGIFGVSLICGIVLTKKRRFFFNRWIYFGGAISFFIFLPHLIWQMENGRPFAEFIANAKAIKMTHMSIPEFLGSQALLIGPLALPISLAGLGYLLFAKRASDYRVWAIAFLSMITIVILQKGKSYYMAPVYPILFCAGAVAAENCATTKIRKTLIMAACEFLLLPSLLIVPLAVPVLRPDNYEKYAVLIKVEAPRDEKHELSMLPQHFADRFGWENMARTVSEVYSGLTEAEKEKCAILAGNYGQAGAMDFFGPKYGLPKAVSIHNSYWMWGPGNMSGEIVISVGVAQDELLKYFAFVDERARVRSANAMPAENNLPVYLCKNMKIPLSEFWRIHKKYI